MKFRSEIGIRNRELLNQQRIKNINLYFDKLHEHISEFYEFIVDKDDISETKKKLIKLIQNTEIDEFKETKKPNRTSRRKK